jgi:hypothetical protein
MNNIYKHVRFGGTAIAVLLATSFATAYGQGNGNNQPTGQGGPSGGGTSNVVVTNSPAQPVPVKEQNNPAFQPFQWNSSGVIATGSDRVDFVFQVPAGKRLVIEQISGQADVVSSLGTVPRLLVGTVGAFGNASAWVPMTYVGNDPGLSPSVYGIQQLRMYADVGTKVGVEVQRSVDSGGSYSGHVNFSVAVTGYLVDVP